MKVCELKAYLERFEPLVEIDIVIYDPLELVEFVPESIVLDDSRPQILIGTVERISM